MTRHRHTPADKATALRLARHHGVRAAASQTGIAENTISYWRTRQRKGLDDETAGRTGDTRGSLHDVLLGVRELRALSRLTPAEREAFVDHLLVGETIQQIADRTGISRSAVGGNLERARMKLRRSLYPGM